MCTVVYCLDSCHIRVCLISAIWLHILCTSTFSRVIVFINYYMFGLMQVFLDVISVSGAQGSSLTARVPALSMNQYHRVHTIKWQNNYICLSEHERLLCPGQWHTQPNCWCFLLVCASVDCTSVEEIEFGFGRLGLEHYRSIEKAFK